MRDFGEILAENRKKKARENNGNITENWWRHES